MRCGLRRHRPVVGRLRNRIGGSRNQFEPPNPPDG